MTEDRFAAKRLHNVIEQRDGKPEFIENILNSGKYCVNGRNDYLETPLIASVKQGINNRIHRARMEQIMKLLLARPEIDVNAADNMGRTALMWAATCPDWEGPADLLIADPRLDCLWMNKKMETALDLATSFRYNWLVKVLTKYQEEGRRPSAVAQPFASQATNSPSTLPVLQYGASVNVAASGAPPPPPLPQYGSSAKVASSGVPPPPPSPPGAGASKAKLPVVTKYVAPTPQRSAVTSTVSNNGSAPPPPPPPGSGGKLPSYSQLVSHSTSQSPSYSTQNPAAAPSDARKLIEIKRLMFNIAHQYNMLECNIGLAKLEGGNTNQVIDKIALLYNEFDKFVTSATQDKCLL